MTMNDRVFKGDTALVEASLFDQDGVNYLPAQTVEYSIKKPDGTIFTATPVSLAETLASILYTDTAQSGLYTTQVTFTLNDPNSTRRSTVLSFEVVDPLETSVSVLTDTNQQKCVERAWMKLEDLFDSELGGPYLRDRTLATFNIDKMARLLDDAFYNINNFYQPATGYTVSNWPYDSQSPLLSQAVLVESVRHLMRSYVEQPAPMGPGTPTYFDRRDYLNRWQMIFTIENDRLNMWMDLFKRDLQGFGHTSMLVGGYASYTSRYPRYMRGRYPYVYRW
jgi:hypothetical protein